MRQCQWNDAMCGTKITPEAWVGGVITDDAVWYIVRDVFDDSEGDPCFNVYYPDDPTDRTAYYTIYQMGTRPIYPPLGFGGLDEPQLWNAVANADDLRMLTIGHSERTSTLIGRHKARNKIHQWKVGVHRQTGIVLETYRNDLKDAPMLIQALQNATVLESRLLEPSKMGCICKRA